MLEMLGIHCLFCPAETLEFLCFFCHRWICLHIFPNALCLVSFCLPWNSGNLLRSLFSVIVEELAVLRSFFGAMDVRTLREANCQCLLDLCFHGKRMELSSTYFSPFVSIAISRNVMLIFLPMLHMLHVCSTKKHLCFLQNYCEWICTQLIYCRLLLLLTNTWKCLSCMLKQSTAEENIQKKLNDYLEKKRDGLICLLESFFYLSSAAYFNPSMNLA